MMVCTVLLMYFIYSMTNIEVQTCASAKYQHID